MLSFEVLEIRTINGQRVEMHIHQLPSVSVSRERSVRARRSMVSRIAPRTFWVCLSRLALAFFGGYYIVAIAAVEAFRMSGGSQIAMHFQDLCEETKMLNEKNKIDDLEDLDNDGVADVLQIEPRELVCHQDSIDYGFSRAHFTCRI